MSPDYKNWMPKGMVLGFFAGAPAFLALAILFPIGLPGYLVGIRHQRNLRRDIAQTVTVCDQLTAILRGEYTRDMEYQVNA